MLRIALAQINTTVGDLKGNRRKVLEYYRLARKVRADIVVFPELVLCGYPPEDLLFKENFVRDNRGILQTLATGIGSTVAVVGFVDSDAGGALYNAAAFMAGGRIKAIYRKQVLPNYGVFDEKRYFKEGRENLLFMLGKYPLGVNICEDIWEENAASHARMRSGAKVLVNISASPYDYGKLERRRKLLGDRARRMKSFVCYTNLVGGQDELVFDGGSLIIDPRGRVVAAGRQFEEDLILADLEVATGSGRRKTTAGLKVVRQALKPVKREPLRMEWPAQLSPDERVLQALILGTRDYIRKNGFRQVVVGLSGGIDSALVTAIAVAAVGAENVIAVSMPSRYSSVATRSDSRRLAGNLNIRFIEVPIQDIFEAYLAGLQPVFSASKPDVTEENLQARIRGNILMALSNKFGWLVLTTGNKSEIAVGYCTLYGDMSGGFAVLKDVPKTKVYELAALINRQYGPWIPDTIIRRAPTAELKENQKDQDSLPPYAVLDDLVRAYVEEHRSLKTIQRMVRNPGVVKKVIRMIDHSEYKRRQAPPGIKITPRAFGKDWRLPITNRYKEF